MDDPNTGRSVTLTHRTCFYPNIQALEGDIADYRASLIARSKGGDNWSNAERQQVLKDCDDYAAMIEEHMVWSAEIEAYDSYMEQKLRENLTNLPDPFGSASD